MNAKECESKINKIDWKGLKDLWQRIEDKNTPGWEPGKAFEYLVVRAFELSGAHVRYPYRIYVSDDEGKQIQIEQIDGAFHFDTLSGLIESKARASPLNIEPIAKIRNQLLRRPSGIVGCVFSASGFKIPALELAKYCAPQIIVLWEPDHIKYCIEKETVKIAFYQKYHHAVEENIIPNFNIKIS